MTSPYDDAIDHHVWATLRVIEACGALSPGQLDAVVPGTYGSIVDTLRHLVDGDAYYLSHLTGSPQIDTDRMTLDALRTAMTADGRAWEAFIAGDLDPTVVVKDVDDGGGERDASIGLRLAQALHHGTDHRSQICTALTTLGVEPPVIDVWAFGEATGRVVESPPA